MKLVVMIPAYNEEATLAKVIDEIPKKISGIDTIQILVIDDGSTDLTASIARKKGAVVLSHKANAGLAKTFRDGLEYALLTLRADIIVNTDADFQYNQTQIPDLVKPVLEGKADIVLGSRFKGWIEDMPLSKKWGNQLATWAVSKVAGAPISDGQTGFRAFSKEAALRLNVLTAYTYTQETIIQAAHLKLKMVEIPIDFRKRADKSRLIGSIWQYARRSFLTLLLGYLTYKPLKVFLSVGGILAGAGAVGGFYVLVHFLRVGMVTPHLPLALLSVALLLMGAQIIMLGLLAEMIKQNRRVQDESLYLQKVSRLNESNRKTIAR